MLAVTQLPLLLAADNRLLKLDLPPVGTEDFSVPALTLILLGATIFSVLFGYWFARSVRMKDYGWKIALILTSFLVSLAVVLFGQYKLGVDLQGGVILVYEIDEVETNALNPKGQEGTWDIGRLVQVLRDRLNETGLKEIVVRPFGPQQIEIVVPEVDPKGIEALKKKITAGGALQFMIVASENQDSQLFELAREQAATPRQRLRRDVQDEEGNRIGFWARMGREQSVDPATAPFRDPGAPLGLIRDSRTGEIIELTAQQQRAFVEEPAAFQQFLTRQGIGSIDALMVYDEEYAIRGENDLASARADRDQNLRPNIAFTMKGEGIYKMGNLTAGNLERKLAIIFDNELKSAAVIRDKISEQGEITGDFTQEEVQFIVDVLKSGSLPVVLHENPISENTIGAILGLDTIRKGSYSVAGALLAVLVFLIGYYRFAGLVAGLALTLNLLLTVAFMVIFQAPFTLPGLAGLVLTVGMSVDANVLIFERMREEQARGATLRMTIRNGFDRALSAIIDGNLTTLLTAIVLYAIGTDQVRGFGATLIIGNITSMFTAIFCSRVVFDIAERTRWLSKLSMTQLLATPSINWCKYLVPASMVSVVVILIGLGATVARGRGLFDIDLRGGTSVTFILKEPQNDAQVRQKVEAVLGDLVDESTDSAVSYSVNEVRVDTERPQTVYKVDSSLPEVTDLQAKLREAFKTESGEGLRTYQVSDVKIDEKQLETPAPPPSSDPLGEPLGGLPETNLPVLTVPTNGAQAEEPKAEEPKTEEPKTDAKAEEKPTEAAPPAADEGEKPESSGCQVEPVEEPAAEEPAAADPTPSAPEPPAPPVASPFAPALPAGPAVPDQQYETTVVLNFPNSAIAADSLIDRLEASAAEAINQEPQLTVEDVENKAWDRKDNSAFEQWTVKLPFSQADAQKVVDHLQAEMQQEVVWQTSSKIGGQVSVDTRWRAVGAMAVSLLGILAYVWFRFHQAIWGIAVIVALFHDALIMLGGLAISYWLAGPL
ncbi:MAG: protein translocase subunit SecD, partial [Pirellulaceae bacterium]